MSLRYFYQFAVAATVLGHSATFLNAQSTAVRQDSDGAVTSLTNLNRPPKDPTSLGRVDANANETIDLSINEELSSGHSEVANPTLSSAAQRAAGQGPMVLLSSSKFAQSRNSQALAASGAYTRASSPRTQPAALPKSFARTAMHSGVHVPDGFRTKTATKGSALCGERSGQIRSSLSEEPESTFGEEKNKDACQRETFLDSAGAASIQAEQPGSMEKLGDPFSGLLKGSFEGFNKSLDMEQSCGVACGLLLTGRFKSFGSEMPGSDQSAKRQDSHGSQARHSTGPAASGLAVGTD